MSIRGRSIPHRNGGLPCRLAWASRIELHREVGVFVAATLESVAPESSNRDVVGARLVTVGAAPGIKKARIGPVGEALPRRLVGIGAVIGAIVRRESVE